MRGKSKTKESVCNVSTSAMTTPGVWLFPHGHTVTCKAAVLAVVSVVTREKNRTEQDFSNNATEKERERERD